MKMDGRYEVFVLDGNDYSMWNAVSLYRAYDCLEKCLDGITKLSLTHRLDREQSLATVGLSIFCNNEEMVEPLNSFFRYAIQQSGISPVL